MDKDTVKAYYCREEVVRYYEMITADTGLWVSEEKVFTRVFKKEESILDLGTGAGRIPIGLYELGYRNVIGVDFSRPMVKAARDLSKRLEYGIPFSVADVMSLSFADNTFEGAIFGFNGLMRIPGEMNRENTLKQVFNLLKPGAWFVFTTHDRDLPGYNAFWEAEAVKWEQGRCDSGLEVFGDLFRKSPCCDANFYIHIPDSQEVKRALEISGFRLEVCAPRAQLANEPEEVTACSEECLFWVAQKPREEMTPALNKAQEDV